MSRAPQDPPTVRCAIYTRKSTEEGLEQEFNSLDAQREAGEAFIASQRMAGWTCCAERYDDGGFSGGNAERPALKRLLEDIESGLVDCVVVYKVDRLSRSLLDFARMMETFERHGVSFVSVTQQFNTAHSMGRLTLNILLSFAQFEREIISERTRDKIAAARKKGKWAGGRPVLGYDIVPGSGGSKLAVNAGEAERVRAIFAVYLEQRSLLRASAILNERGWTTKAWTAKNGSPQGGRRFDKAVLYKLLTNPVYVGKVRHHEDLYDGEHEAIVGEGVFAEVGRQLASNNARDGRSPLNKHGALLKGLVRCQSCGCGMCHHFATAKAKGGRGGGGGSKRYRYYVCTRAQNEGWSVCPGPSLPADDQPTAADLTIVLLHGAPDALERIFAEQLTFRGRRLRTHLALCDTAPQVTNVPDHLLESIRVSLDEHFEARGRGRGVRVFAVTTDGGFRLLIRRGDPLHREATIDPDSGDTRHIAFHRERYDMAIYKCRDGELQLNARDDTDVEAYLTAIGYFIFNDQTLFLGEGLPARYTLEPIVQHGADCLDVGGVPGLKSVRMTSAEWYHGKASGLRTIKRASDIFGAFRFERETIPRGVKLTAASFRLQFTDRRETSVRIVLPNNAVIGRDVDAEAVRQWLTFRGFVVDREEANRGLTRSLLATS